MVPMLILGRRATLHANLSRSPTDSMLVSQFMTPEPIVIAPDARLEDAFDAMEHAAVRHLPVVDGDRLVGVLSNRDLMGALGTRAYAEEVYDESRPKFVDQVMHTDVVTVRPDDNVVSAAVEVSVRGVGCLPVLQDGRLIGIVSEMDLVRLVSEQEGDLLAVRSIGTERACVVTEDASVAQIDEVMFAKGVRHVPVVDAGKRVVGIVSDRDVRRGKASGIPGDAPVGDLMSKGVVTVSSDLPLSQAAAVMADRRVSALVVTNDGSDPGILTTTDVVEHALGSLGAS